MAKHRTHEVRQKVRKDPNHVGTITREQILKMDRAGRRQERIESGINTMSGSGVHGGGKRDRNRKDRREGRQQIKNSDWS
ncbi:MAG: hypothetical protein IT342_23365 [Candidatus Melainabacteria bacterium]|nr:hypothetical protein [Candidatus Melainabacteria bacterium]